MSVAEELAQNNESYAKAFDEEKASLKGPPTWHLAVITCMDARIDVYAILGLKPGEAHVIRNAGGRAFDAIRSLLISQHFLETREVMVIHHTRCGMAGLTDDIGRAKLKKDVHPPSILPAMTPVIDSMAFLGFNADEAERAVREDVKFVRENPLVIGKDVSGWIYDVDTGKLKPVPTN